jgi:hypothetical protein
MKDERGYRCGQADENGMYYTETGNHVLCQDQATLNERIAEFEKVARGLVEYRRMNTLNFQLEKADYWIDQLATLLPKEPHNG